MVIADGDAATLERVTVGKNKMHCSSGLLPEICPFCSGPYAAAILIALVVPSFCWKNEAITDTASSTNVPSS